MRWLFLFVLSLNLVYIAWELNSLPVDPYANIQPLKNVVPIVLLSELEQNTTTDIADATQVIAEDSTAPVAEVKPEPAPVSVPVLSAEPALEPKPVAEPIIEAPVIKTDAALAQQTLVTAEIVAKTDKTAEITPEASATHACYTLGPFRDLNKLRRLSREIKSYVVTANFRGKEEKQQSLYWVYLKPEKSRSEAIATGRRLKAKKIKDFYVIREGEKINGISLGYFRNKNGAAGLVKKVDKLGFNVVMEPVYKTHTIYWLDYQLVDGVAIPESVFDTYLKSTKESKIRHFSRECND